MNAAARLVHQSVLSRQLILTYFLTKKQALMLLFTLAILISGLSIIYNTHITRLMYSGYQRELLEQTQLHIQRSQLLLERSTLLTQPRIQQIAVNKLGMLMPDQKSVVIIHE